MHPGTPRDGGSTLRRRALEKLGRLTTRHSTTSASDAGFERLCKQVVHPSSKAPINGDTPKSWTSVAHAPMSVRELETLLALCKAATAVRRIEQAEQLVAQIGPYLCEAHEQRFVHSPYLHDFRPSPWELIAHHVTLALLQIGAQHPVLRSQALKHLKTAVNAWLELSSSIINAEPQTPQPDDDDPDTQEMQGQTVRLCVSLVGLLDALADSPASLLPSERFALLQEIHGILDQEFMIKIEGRLSYIRNSSPRYHDQHSWSHILTTYATSGRPLGAILLQNSFMRYLAAASSLFVVPREIVTSGDTLDYLLECKYPLQTFSGDDTADGVVEILAGYVVSAINLIEEDADYLQMSSVSQQRLSNAMKAYSFRIFLYLSLLEDGADADVLMSWLEGVLADPTQLSDEDLSQTALKCMTILARTSNTFASNLGRSLPRIIVQRKLTADTASIAAQCLAQVLMQLPQDVQISTLYSLGNVLSTASDASHFGTTALDGAAASFQAGPFYSQDSHGSAITLTTNDVDEMTTVHETVVQAVVAFATKSGDEKMISLAISLLVQKVGKVSTFIDGKILVGSALLAAKGSGNDLRPIVRFYARVCEQCLRNGNDQLLKDCMAARLVLAREIPKTSPLYETYLMHLLDMIVSTTGAIQSDKGSVRDGILGAEEIAQIIGPLAVLISKQPEVEPLVKDIQAGRDLARDAWYNLVAHDFTLNSHLTKRHGSVLETLAIYSPSIVDVDRANVRESGVELNTVLRRNENPAHTAQQKQVLIQAFPQHESDIRSLEYAELTFLNVAHLIAVLRARNGSCTRTMEYFNDSKFKTGTLSNVLMDIARVEVDEYLKGTMGDHLEKYAAPELAQQLVKLFEGCCHRISKVRQVALAAAGNIISRVPASLCQRTALFAMLELLTLMWNSCLDEETEDVDYRHEYKSKRGGVTIYLSDDFQARRETLVTFQRSCKMWVISTLEHMPQDMRAQLQTYLSDFVDEGAYGHVALGRSFALEMGCQVPSADLRIGNVDQRLDLGITSASDFLAQYTTRQEYRTIDSIFDDDQDAILSRSRLSYISYKELAVEVQDATKDLMALFAKIDAGDAVEISELRPTLRRGAALLCRSDVDDRALVTLLVKLPCLIYTRESIKLGSSLWMGVLSENPRLESQILMEILAQAEDIYRTGRAAVGNILSHPDPFFVQQEFAPSDKETMVRRQRLAEEYLSPSIRLQQFLDGRFNATRYTSQSMRRAYKRYVLNCMATVWQAPPQPLAREAHMRLTLAGATAVLACPSSSEDNRWLEQDLVLRTGLKWFAMTPKWSYGSNQLQLKVDIRAINNLIQKIQNLVNILGRSKQARPSLRSKIDLLVAFLQDEAQRLTVWLSPLSVKSSHASLLHHSNTAKLSTITAAALLPVAFAESGSLAVQLAARFHSPQCLAQLRNLLVNEPLRVVEEPQALAVLLGQGSGQSGSQQVDHPANSSAMPVSGTEKYLKYLLYWANVDPPSAVTYFLPAFGGHAFVVQYAVRALESHSVDVTFFYVPQIVQTLRFDSQGYVERYIIETAKFSRLFAHQIIWNMKANAYKDEDSQVPDAIKPTLDKVMSSLINSFTSEDKDFYEREFAFFNEVTSISGKLRPFIKRPKPEKKQKIEEELRKIKVDVGVYLPSNPDGVVVGIDRQSGKPLQSHAKAPYMATFYIRRQKKSLDDAAGALARRHAGHSRGASLETTTLAGLDRLGYYETWQSAIFKVGDDCRQDVLALQLVSTFRSIFNNVGLDVYVFPYRVTATAPGCGVIDVLPNSISRDMLGREQVNGLYEYFLSHFGSEDSLAFQQARANFIKSMAAYSVISYLLQFKDRHNGNIMIDDQGHVLHIDFGFLFDIAPGGVRFERAPFKLTGEMVAVMGGSPTSAPYRRFEELCVKAFLACRPYADKLASLVTPMLESGLPCFKPETIKHLRERFVLEKSEREAAEFMRMLVRRSESSYSTRGYDQFQLLTNGIPY